MALRAVVGHPKFDDLKMRLGLDKWQALGVLEALWHFCGRYTPAGDIGKYSDDAIEAWFEWRGERGRLVAELIAAGWIDPSRKFRLLVHDWHKHADDATKLALKRAGRGFAALEEEFVPTLSGQCGDSVATVSVLPEPVPVPETEKNLPLPLPAVVETVDAVVSPEEKLPDESGIGNIGPYGRASGSRGAPEKEQATAKATAKAREDTAWAAECDDVGKLAIAGAAGRVMRMCGWSNPRMLPVIIAAIQGYLSGDRTRELCVTERLMVDNWAKLRQNGHLMHYRVNERKFIQRGLWIDDASWPWSNDRLRSWRLQSEAAIGSFHPN